MASSTDSKAPKRRGKKRQRDLTEEEVTLEAEKKFKLAAHNAWVRVFNAHVIKSRAKFLRGLIEDKGFTPIDVHFDYPMMGKEFDCISAVHVRYGYNKHLVLQHIIRMEDNKELKYKSSFTVLNSHDSDSLNVPNLNTIQKWLKGTGYESSDGKLLDMWQTINSWFMRYKDLDVAEPMTDT